MDLRVCFVFVLLHHIHLLIAHRSQFRNILCDRLDQMENLTSQTQTASVKIPMEIQMKWDKKKNRRIEITRHDLHFDW